MFSLKNDQRNPYFFFHLETYTFRHRILHQLEKLVNMVQEFLNLVCGASQTSPKNDIFLNFSCIFASRKARLLPALIKTPQPPFQALIPSYGLSRDATCTNFPFPRNPRFSQKFHIQIQPFLQENRPFFHIHHHSIHFL